MQAVPVAEIPPFLADMPRVDTFAEIDEVFRSPDFHQGAHWESAPLYEGCLLMTDGPAHLERRRMVSSMFSRASLEYYETEALAPVIRAVLEELKATRGADGLVRADLVPLLRVFLHRITALVTGVDGVDTPAKTARFQHLVETLEAAVGVEWSTRDHDEVLQEGIAGRRALIEEFLLPSLQRRIALVERMRAGEIGKQDLPVDLLTLLASHGETGAEGEDSYIWRECALFLVAATQTTSHALPHVIAHLNEWWREHPGDRGKVADMEFLRRAANESLRLHQPAPVLVRRTQRDVTISSGRSFRAGDQVALFFTPANRDQGVDGADADYFNLDRPIAKKPPPWGLTFGGGVHLCLGRPLVTGLSKATDSGDTTTQGTMVRLLRGLFGAGLELDPERPPQRNAASFHDAYASMPIILRKL